MRYVARMQRSVIRGTVNETAIATPDCISFHPGYTRFAMPLGFDT
jgi:hypothetical protein